ncbi:ParB N-terminal domain-containing protein [Halalkalibacter akibai]|uniref:ParB-like nuclease domain protein n=1 Tax=Halalkalibacter akibai (strain ATCC 43226 / DSM 21942 / CIP 109018 / JCM 9157 / 1139) TaxID=1236973 RepID=W4QTV9_HALA3|nr:ParB N-terminal domain-containing protein [Halalkalibacter akibai]GAE35600.1 ParB-like nuclease domain protein [Halalkalibacter akibai JCM 9157]
MNNGEVLIPINKLKYDSIPRVHLNNSSLYDDVKANGLNKPLEVEGPDVNGNYFILDGLRRIEAIKEIRSLFPLKFREVKCLVVKQLSSQFDRNMERLGESFHSRRRTGIERQFMIEEALKNGLTEKELSKQLNIPISTLRKCLKGSNVPEELRVEIAKLRASQEALDVIYHLDLEDEFIEALLTELRNRSITTVHAAALKKTLKDEMYSLLEEEGKKESLLLTLREGQFTKSHARRIVLEEVIKTNPERAADGDIVQWVENLCSELEKMSQKVHPKVGDQVEDQFQKRRLKNALSELNKKLKWIYGEKTEKGGFRYRFEENDDENDHVL